PFETPMLTGYFSAAGGRLASVKLKDFTLLNDKSKLYQLAGKHKRGLGFETSFPELQLAKQNFKQISTPDTEVFIFESQTENGVTVRKKYDLFPDKNYQVKLTVTLRNERENSTLLDNVHFPVGPKGRGGAALNWGPGFGITRKNESRFDRTYWYYGKKGAMEYFSPGGGGGFFGFFGENNEDIEGQFARGPVDWTAVSGRYFIAGIAPDRPYDMIYLDDRNGTGEFTTWSAYSDISLESSETMEFNYDLFLGPKDYNTLNEFHPGMEKTLNYGWFTILVRPLQWGLNSIYSAIPNYGFAIIILSIIIKMLLYPLTKKGLTSMQKMKELQPKIKEIQEKYEDDKEKLNKEMMKFYQEHDVNPVGGCLPMLLQLPIFIGLYRMLQYNVNLRGAPFIFWITDLSSRDPYYILPVLMGIIMFAQQYYTMSAGSSGGAMGQQKTMAYVMPVVFVFMFMTFPVGLVLYWMTNSGATLVQYWLIYRSTE
ncbi:MAG: membrane protein insertase YidC, partial [bacterium]